MNRCLIFLASLVLTFVTVASVCGASPADWGRPMFTPASEAGSGGHRSAGWPAVMPSQLVAIDVISL